MNSVKVTFDLFEERLIHIQNLMRMGYSKKISLSILMVLASVSGGDAGLKKAEDALIDIKGRLSPPTTVVVQPFEGFPDSDLDYVVKRLKVDFTGSVVVREAVPLPKEAYNRPRSRYYADSCSIFCRGGWDAMRKSWGSPTAIWVPKRILPPFLGEWD